MKLLQRFIPFLSLIWIMLFISSCNLFNGVTANAGNQSTTQSSTTPISTPIATPTPIPPVSTNCPTTGKARVAIMPTLAAGKQQGILYTTSTSSGDYYTGKHISTLDFYNTMSNETKQLLQITVPANLQNHQTIGDAISQERISNNGQWIVFKTAIEGKEAIQLVRADGQELQTLYCTTTNTDLGGSLSFSPDTKYLTFEESPASGAGSLNLMFLNLATADIHALTQVSNTTAAAGLYEPIKWRDDTSLYLNYSLSGVGGTRNRSKISLLTDITQSSAPPPISMPTIAGGSNDKCKDFDFSSDNTKILFSDCSAISSAGPGTEPKGPSTIETVPLVGGSPQIIHTSQHAITNARFLTNASIWFVVNDYPGTSSNGIWKMNLDGTDITQLTTTGSFVDLSYSSRMNLSPDGTTFAFLGPLTYSNGSFTGSSMVVGSINGGNPTTVTVSNIASLVGWTTA